MKLRDILNRLKYRITPDPDAIRNDILNEVSHEQSRKKNQ